MHGERYLRGMHGKGIHMKHRLIILEGLPCSGKSTISAYISDLLKPKEKVCFVDEGTGDHPADYEFHALAPAGLLSSDSHIVSLSEFSGEQLKQLLPYKIYDGLPWETERPLMLDKWRQFVWNADDDTVYVFNCVLLQNPMCETMMRFDFTEAQSQYYIEEIAEIIRPLNPLVVYLKNDEIADSVRNASLERPGWLDAVIDYHVQGAYGKRIGAEGFDGYIQCLCERQRRELNILSSLSLDQIVLDNPQRDWKKAKEVLHEYLKKKRA